MAKTPSNMVSLGTTAPNFKLPDVISQKMVSKQIKGLNGTLIMFICNHFICKTYKCNNCKFG